MSASPLSDLEPRHLWRHFDALRQIPRPSKKEERVAAHVRAWAEERSFEVRADDAGNLVVRVPASAGREEAPRVVLQAHLDMVCEKNADVEHDFDTDPIEIEVDGDIVRAKGTTLGADNGIGAAAAMAMADDPEVVHGPLDLLFTLDEETGLNGASALDGSIVEGRLLLNLDTEEDAAFYIGCAGASGIEARLPLDREAARGGVGAARLAVRGLRGGHSGLEIGENRGNAIQILVNLLLRAERDGIDVALIDLEGGGKRNAIPRECFADLLLRDFDAFEEHLDFARHALTEQYGKIEPGLTVELTSGGVKRATPLTSESRDRLLRAIAATPSGILAMSNEVPGLVETSNNLASVVTSEGAADLLCSFRSSVNPALADTMLALGSLYRLAGAEVREQTGYPGWAPNPESDLVRRAVAVHERVFGEPPAIKAVHAGLECGILIQKLPGLDAVSLGPTIRGAHSPDEHTQISSVARFDHLLREILAELATPAEDTTPAEDAEDA